VEEVWSTFHNAGRKAHCRLKTSETAVSTALHPGVAWPASAAMLTIGVLYLRAIHSAVCMCGAQGGGSEVWHSPEGFSVASLAFHPSDNVLMFAIGNRLRFWAWELKEPYHEARTAREFEKIRL